MSRHKPLPRPHRKPGPKPKAETWVEGRDYYCGHCTGHKVIACPECFDGCPDCMGVGQVACPVCNGGTVPTPRPEW